MKLKKRKLLTLLAIASVFLFVSCQKDDYTEIVGLCPIVVSTNPVNGATSVPLLNVITVSFNERMNPATLNATSFSLQAASAVAGTISYTDTTATFTPASPLSPNTTYTGKVTTAAKSLKGNALQADYVWSFSTFQ